MLPVSSAVRRQTPPVEQASVFEFTINMRVAKALNLTLSPLLARPTR
jgi:hypothetical protein